MSYLLVTDLDAKIARASELGADLEMGPMAIEWGRFAQLTTPGCAPFGFFEGTESIPQDGVS